MFKCTFTYGLIINNISAIHMVSNTPINWYALYTKPRHEFVVHGELQKKGIESFLPSFSRLQQWKDRK